MAAATFEPGILFRVNGYAIFMLDIFFITTAFRTLIDEISVQFDVSEEIYLDGQTTLEIREALVALLLADQFRHYVNGFQKLSLMSQLSVLLGYYYQEHKDFLITIQKRMFCS